MATLAAIRWNSAVRAIYDRLRSGGILAKAALVAAMRKLLAFLNAVVRDHQGRKAA